MRIILHIGSEKTGTTSIQNALRNDCLRLKKDGVLYPVLFGSENHMEIAVCAADDNVVSELRLLELNKLGLNIHEYRAKLQEKLSNELHSGDYHTVIVSNEHCHSRIKSNAEMERLRSMLNYFTSDIKVIVYLRRQDLLAVSLYSTKMKLGGNGPVFPNITSKMLLPYFCYDLLLERYAKFFGKQNIIVRIYEPGLLVDGDVVSDFYRVAELGESPNVKFKSNPSLSAKQLVFLKLFNDRFPLLLNGEINIHRGNIYSVIKDVLQGPKFTPTRSDAERFYCSFKHSNLRVYNDYSLDISRTVLFDEDFSHYPENEPTSSLTNSDFMDFIEAIWKRNIGFM